MSRKESVSLNSRLRRKHQRILLLCMFCLLNGKKYFMIQLKLPYKVKKKRKKKERKKEESKQNPR